MPSALFCMIPSIFMNSSPRRGYPHTYPHGILRETGLAGSNTVAVEVIAMTAAIWLMLSGLLQSLQLQTGSFPKTLTAEEERRYLALARQGDLEARNVLIERNLRLVAHIMNKS